MVTGNAVGASPRMRCEKRRRTLAAELFEANPDDIEFAGGASIRRRARRNMVSRSGTWRWWPIPSVTPTALRPPRPSRCSSSDPVRLSPEGTDPGLEARKYFSPTQATFASGNHAAIIEVDPETGIVTILKYVAVHDCGRVINPMIVEGQVHGGVAQGIGGSFYERLVYDARGATTLDHIYGLT